MISKADIRVPAFASFALGRMTIRLTFENFLLRITHTHTHTHTHIQTRAYSIDEHSAQLLLLLLLPPPPLHLRPR
jgi:hypothetical protein